MIQNVTDNLNVDIKITDTRKHKKRNKTIRFSDDFYVYDIESTKYSNEEYPILAYSYLHGLKKYNFNINLNKDNISDYSSKYIPLRTNKEAEDFILKLNKEYEKRNEKLLMFVHNLTYEFYNIIFNMPKINKILEKDEKNVFAINSTKICKIKIGNIEIRDSLILFGKSLKVCANEVGMRKNEENKTYNEVWTETSKLPEWEYSYNEHDLDIVAVYFSKYVKLLNLKHNTIQGFCNTKILTITGMVKYLSKQVNTRTDYVTQMLIAKETQQSIDFNTQKWIEDLVFRGGFCKSVPYYTFNINKNVYSIDFASAYPAVMTTGYFPKGELIDSVGKLKKLDDELKCLSLSEIVNKYWNFNSIANPNQPILFKARIKNVYIKNYNNNQIGYLTISKSEDEINCVTMNGSIYSADSVIISGTDLDYIIMRMYYEFDLDEIFIEKTTNNISRMSNFKYVAISKFAQEKEGFKKLSRITDYNEFNNKLNEILYDDIKFNDIFSTTNEKPTQDNMKHITHICGSYLMKSKNNLNSQYGISVQHQFQQVIKYENYQFNVDDEEELHWSRCENYLQGVYVTAHTRFRLLLMTAKLICNNFNIIYFDTDSIKLMGDKDKLFDLLNEWNDIIEELRNRAKISFKSKNIDLFLSNFGNFDYEGCYKYFMTHGSKRYITVDEDDEVHTTISGVNKIANSSSATIFYKRYGINELYSEWFGLNTLYDYPLCKRSLSFIPDKPILINDEIIDDNNEIQKVKQYSCEGISENDCGYLLSGYTKPISPILFWYFYCLGLRDEKIKMNIKPHTIQAFNCVYDDDNNMLDCEFKITDGYVIEKYYENFEIKYKKLIKEDKLLKCKEAVFENKHNFKNGII